MSRDLAVKAPRLSRGAELDPVCDGELSLQCVELPDFPVWLMVCWLLPDTQSPTQSNCLLPTHG